MLRGIKVHDYRPVPFHCPLHLFHALVMNTTQRKKRHFSSKEGPHQPMMLTNFHAAAVDLIKPLFISHSLRCHSH